jgi:hypothetical protein
MSVDAKICGINSAPALEAAVKGGARFVGFIFCPQPAVLDAGPPPPRLAVTGASAAWG